VVGRNKREKKIPVNNHIGFGVEEGQGPIIYRVSERKKYYRWGGGAQSDARTLIPPDERGKFLTLGRRYKRNMWKGHKPTKRE